MNFKHRVLVTSQHVVVPALAVRLPQEDGFVVRARCKICTVVAEADGEDFALMAGEQHDGCVQRRCSPHTLRRPCMPPHKSFAPVKTAAAGHTQIHKYLCFHIDQYTQNTSLN